MAKKIIVLVAIIFSMATAFSQNNLLDSLLSGKSFFLLKDTLASGKIRLAQKDSLYYYSFLDNFFNESANSNKCIDLLLKKYPRELSANKQIALLKLSIDNYVKTYEYSAAFKRSEWLLDKYGRSMSHTDREDVSNSMVIWRGLRDIAPQQIQIINDTRIPYKRDLAGLLNIPVNSKKDSSQYFVFDTGANLSVITESNAKKNKLLLMNDYFQVTAITGIKIKAHCGIADSLRIGDIIVRNVVFIVFPDSALSFGPKYKIEGIIGFPVIEQLAEVRINKNGFMEIPALPKDEEDSNLGLDELTPVINLRYRDGFLPFTFDTGGQQTFLNAIFYKKYRGEIEATGKEDYMRYGGAGGLDSVKSYELPAIDFEIAGKPVHLKNISVKTIPISPKENIYYGNLGQDAITQYNEVIINFRYMYLSFSNKN